MKKDKLRMETRSCGIMEGTEKKYRCAKERRRAKAAPVSSAPQAAAAAEAANTEPDQMSKPKQTKHTREKIQNEARFESC